jgi:hypothetical protein
VEKTPESLSPDCPQFLRPSDTDPVRSDHVPVVGHILSQTFQEKVSIRRVRQLRTQIENELRCWSTDTEAEQHEKELTLQNVSAKT